MFLFCGITYVSIVLRCKLVGRRWYILSLRYLHKNKSGKVKSDKLGGSSISARKEINVWRAVPGTWHAHGQKTLSPNSHFKNGNMVWSVCNPCSFKENDIVCRVAYDNDNIRSPLRSPKLPSSQSERARHRVWSPKTHCSSKMLKHRISFDIQLKFCDKYFKHRVVFLVTTKNFKTSF